MATNSKKTGTAAKIGVMTFLLSVRCNRIFNPDFVGSGRTSGHVLQQRRWGISLGR